MFRDLHDDDLMALWARASTSAGSNLEVMLGLALAWIRIELGRELAERANLTSSVPRARAEKGSQTPSKPDAGAGQGEGQSGPASQVEGQAQGSGGAAS